MLITPRTYGFQEVAYSSSSAYIVALRSIPGLTDRIMEKDWVLRRVEKVGFNADVIDDIITCESGWRHEATHLNKNGTKDIGLWQINDIHGLSVEDRMDIYKSTEFAIKLLNSKRGFNHWVCFRQLST